jgi:hypothetical protein
MERVATRKSSLLLSAAVLAACSGKKPSRHLLLLPQAHTGSPRSQRCPRHQRQIQPAPKPPKARSFLEYGVHRALVCQAADESNLFDIRVSGGGIQSFTAPTTPGTYPFHCKYHANMHGLLTVQ